MRGGSSRLIFLVCYLVLAAQAPPLNETAAAQASSPAYPLIQIEHPTQGAVVRGNVEFYGRIIDPDLASVSAKWWMDDGDPSPVKLVDGTWHINWTAIGPNQTHIFQIQAANGMNQTSQENRVFRYEPLGPSQAADGSQGESLKDSLLTLNHWAFKVSAAVVAGITVGIVTWLIRKHFDRARPALRVRGALRHFPFDERLKAGSIRIRVANEGGAGGELDWGKTELYVRSFERFSWLPQRWQVRPRRVWDWLGRPWSKWESAGVELYHPDFFHATSPLANSSGYAAMPTQDSIAPRTRVNGLDIPAGSAREFILVFHESSAWTNECVLVIRPVTGRGHRWHLPAQRKSE